MQKHVSWNISRIKELIVELASQPKLDDFDFDSVSCKLTYPLGHSRFVRNLNQSQKGEFGPEWSFTIGSNIVLYNLIGVSYHGESDRRLSR